MGNIVEGGEYKWSAHIPINGNFEASKCKGLARLDKKSNGVTVTIPDFSEKEGHILVSTGKQKDIEIHTFPGNAQRCYARINEGTLHLSNTPASLFRKNEKIKLNGEVLLRQISNLFKPLDDLFADIKLLESSSVFKIRNNSIKFSESKIKPVKSTTASTQECILNKFKNICAEGNPISILLSGGIDSRFNLALCSYHAKKYKNRIVAYHEYKDKKEHDVAKTVADRLNIPFISITRDRYRTEPLKYILSPEFIEFHGGIYRDALVRWYSYLDLIKSDNPGSTIIGFSSDAHKGRFYRDIKKLPKDANKILISELIPHGIEKRICTIRFQQNDKGIFFNNL